MKPVYLIGEPFEMDIGNPQSDGLQVWVPSASLLRGSMRDMATKTALNKSGAGGWTGWPGAGSPAYDATFWYEYATTQAIFTSQAYTVMIWFKWDGVNMAAPQDWACVASNGWYGQSDFCILINRAGGNLRGYTNTSFCCNYAGNIGTSPRCVAYSFQSGAQSMYLDGVLVATNTVATTVPGLAQALRIGAENRATPYIFSGQIGEFRYYNRVLSQAEIVNATLNQWNLYKPIRGNVFYGKLVSPAMRWWHGA